MWGGNETPFRNVEMDLVQLFFTVFDNITGFCCCEMLGVGKSVSLHMCLQKPQNVLLLSARADTQITLSSCYNSRNRHQLLRKQSFT